MPATAADDRAAEDGRDVVPAEASPRRMPGAVETVAREIREVDAAHERQLVVDDHELLVMAVQRPLVRVERAHDGAALHSASRTLAHGAARHRIHRQGRPAPEQHAHGHAAGGVREQVVQDHRRLAGRQREARASRTSRRCGRASARPRSPRPSAGTPLLRRPAPRSRCRSLGGSPPTAQAASDADNACSQPTLRRRRR